MADNAIMEGEFAKRVLVSVLLAITFFLGACAGQAERAAEPARSEAALILALDITEAGVVTGVRVDTSSGHPELDESALNAAKKWKFSPAMKNGRAVAMKNYKVKVVFDLDDPESPVRRDGQEISLDTAPSP